MSLLCTINLKKKKRKKRVKRVRRGSDVWDGAGASRPRRDTERNREGRAARGRNSQRPTGREQSLLAPEFVESDKTKLWHIVPPARTGCRTGSGSRACPACPLLPGCFVLNIKSLSSFLRKHFRRAWLKGSWHLAQQTAQAGPFHSSACLGPHRTKN